MKPKRTNMLQASIFKLQENGFVGLYLTIVVLILMVGIIVSIGFGVLTQQRIIGNITQSAQAYMAAESGVEDAILRLQKSWNWTSPYTFSVGDADAEISISAIIGGSRTITVEGEVNNRIRNAQIVYQLVTSGTANFVYGAQIGDGGIIMHQNAAIWGNAFSNGDVEMANNAGFGSIFYGVPGSVEIAGVGGRLYGISGSPFVNGDVIADICEDIPLIQGILKANTSNGCGSIDEVLGIPSDPIPLPITTTQISTWKTEAASGGVITGDVTIPSGPPTSLGPARITGNLVVQNNARLILTGNLWVEGNVDIQNQSNNQPAVSLSSGYGGSSGMIITDGKVTLVPNADATGSGAAGSYFMYLSTYNQPLNSDPTIVINNNADADILYASDGWIFVDNNAEIREVTGYGVEIDQNGKIEYEVGLQNTNFSNGPAGGWKVVSWREVE